MAADFTPPPPSARDPEATPPLRSGFPGRCQAIRAAVGNGQDSDAIKLLMDLAMEYGSTEDRNEALVHSGNYTKLRREYRIRQRPIEQLNTENDSLMNRVLQLVDAIEEGQKR